MVIHESIERIVAEYSKVLLDVKKFGKSKGRKFKIVTGDSVTTSAMSFDKFGDWYYFKNLPGILLKGGLNAFRDRRNAGRFWYDVDR
jgi:hypothetical protein